MKGRISKFIIGATAGVLIALAVFAIACSLTSCSEADKVNQNISKSADYFNCERRVVVYNARTDKIIMEVEGYISLSNNASQELVITVKTGADTYKKNYVYLNEYTLYTVEDITGTHTDPYHYVWYWHTELLPEIEVKP